MLWLILENVVLPWQVRITSFTMQRRPFVIALLLFATILKVDAKNRIEGDPPTMSFGIEQDVLPYFLNGYILTGWIGRDFSRYRFSYAEASTPGFYLSDNIASDNVKAFGLSYEYFFKENFLGLWFGPGIGFWTNSIESDLGLTAINQSAIFTLGGGYNIPIGKFFYISPWVAVHSRVSGTQTIPLGNTIYQPARFTPEVSFKIGLKWPT